MSKQPTPPSPAGLTKRCAIYTRKSTTMGLEQEFNSLDAQREAALAYIRRQPGWTLVDTHYDDGGFTGANIERPAFQRLLADIEAGKVDVVVVYKVDRLSRSLLDFAKVMERFSKSGASFVSVTQNFSTADAMGRLTLNMLMSFAEFERSMISERTRDKIAASRRRGQWTGGPVPFGYEVKAKKLGISETEAPIVREAFALFLKYRQAAIVARLLNDRSMLPRGATNNPAKQGLRWTKDSISRLLRNPLYAGQMMYGKELHPGQHPRLIDEATHHEVMLSLAGKRRELRYTGVNHDYVLRGLVRCGRCGAAMSPASTKKGKTVHRYYRCCTRDKEGRQVCGTRQLPAGALEEFVVERIALATADGSLVAEVERQMRERTDARRKANEELRKRLPDEIANASSAATRYVEELGRLQGRSRELVEAKLRTETDRLTAAEQRLAQAENDRIDVEVADAEREWIVRALRDFDRVWSLMTPENRGRLARSLVVAIRVDEASNQVEVELVNFAADEASEAA
ncbi:MAG: resolvase [Archangium gephyra]|jgi:site-specific DNA recombinase|uniref:Resolvase n=1 Tax=Archangium gephyra TaxID=48 RepID=A0A2W5T217_9BACT|nr:MAG: resolvase [Archangium gephyra]